MRLLFPTQGWACSQPICHPVSGTVSLFHRPQPAGGRAAKENIIREHRTGSERLARDWAITLKNLTKQNKGQTEPRAVFKSLTHSKTTLEKPNFTFLSQFKQEPTLLDIGVADWERGALSSVSQSLPAADPLPLGSQKTSSACLAPLRRVKFVRSEV